MPERLSEVTIRDRDTEEVMSLRTYGGLGRIPIGAELWVDCQDRLYMAGTYQDESRRPTHPLTVSLTTSASEHLAFIYRKRRLRSARWVAVSERALA